MEVDGPVIGWNSWRHFSWLTMASDSSADLIVNRNSTGPDLDDTIGSVTNAGGPTGMMENYSLTETILISAVLLFIIVGTVVGNILVCVAVCLVRRLRRPCNYLLVSLAVSDLCVALLVMPMALVYEVLGTWPFGARACDTWVAFDVLSCTASILNLCMISVDRYWAITRPLDYGVKRTPARMISCVALVWISSACISLPPLLVLGNEHGPSPLTFPVNNNNVSRNHQPAAAGPATTTTTTSNWIELLVTKTTSDDSAGLQDYQCQVCQEFGYQIYATLGSFYIPLAVMAAVYYQIFQAAKRIVDEEKKAQSHLLMTRTNSSCTTTKQKTTTTTTTTSNPPPPGQQQKATSSSSLLVHPAHRHHQPVSCNSAAMVVVRRHSDRQVNEERNSNKETNSSLPETNNSPPPLTHNESSWTNNCNGNNYPVTTHWPDNHSKPQQQQQQQQPKTVDISRNSLSVSMDNVTGETTIPVVLSHPIDALSYVEQQKQPGLLIHQSGLNPFPMRHRRNRSHRLTHGRASRVRLRFALNKERKASTTLGIIMSAFTLCWFPFFVLALVRPFMSHQTASLVIPHWLSSLFLWLGYANSFLNPVIYATTNKDFRLPFREILCLRCKSLNSVMREDFYQSQYGNNQHQLMGNNNKGGLMATGGHPSSSPSSHAKLQGGHNHKSRRRRRYSTDCLADDDEQQNERIISHQQDQQPNASAISKVDGSVSATGDEEEDTVTDYGLMSSGHRISSSSATAFL